MRTKNQIFKGLIMLLLVVVSTMGSRAQTDDSDTQLVCPGTEPYKINPGDPGNTFLWSISTGVSGTDWTIVSANSATTDIIWASPLTAQTYTVTFKEVDPLTLCYEELSLEVTVNPLPVPVIAGPATACENEKDVKYSTPDIPGNTYTWVVTGGTVTAGNETHEITVTWETSGPGTVAVTETVAAANCELTVSFPVKVNPAPAPVIAGKAIVCQNEKDVVYSTPDVSGNTYSWLVKGGIVTAGAVPHEITVTWDAIGPWSVEVTETITATTCSATVSIPVVVNLAPAPVIAGLTTVCGTVEDVVYSTPDIAGNTYSWVVTGGNITAGAGPHEITVTWDAIGPWSVEVTETITVTTCSATVSIPVVVNLAPAPVIEGKMIACQNEKVVIYSTPDILGNTYSWVVTGGTVTAGVGTNEIKVTWYAIGQGSVEVTETITISTCNTKVSIPVQVKPIPTTSKILHD